MNYTYAELAKMIDHALLHPTMTEAEAIAGCQMAVAYDIATVCVKPYWVPRAAEVLAGTDVIVSCVVGFPAGNSATEVKRYETQLACQQGAREIDMVINVAKALEGARSPLERQYRASFLTNYNFTGGKLKGFAVGGSERWESRAAIGFYGKVGDPINSPTVINLNDVNRPVYDSGNYFTDLWISYSRKVFNNKIGWKLQLNVNNLFGEEDLLPFAATAAGVNRWTYQRQRQSWALQAAFTF
jgi:hypothetical protein